MTLEVLPAKFSAAAELELSLEDCRSALAELGFGDLPLTICNPSRLKEALVTTRERGERLTTDQLDDFIRRTVGGKHGRTNA